MSAERAIADHRSNASLAKTAFRNNLCANILLTAGIGLLFGASPSEIIAQQYQSDPEISREYPIKAAYLYNFGRYVEWPAASFGEKDAPFVIGIGGEEGIGEILDSIAHEKKLEGRSIVIKRFNSSADFSACHILFISRSVSEAEEERFLAKARGNPILVVGEKPEFLSRGGIINFTVEDNKVRFEISPKDAKIAGLKISAKLLSLAKIADHEKQ